MPSLKYTPGQVPSITQKNHKFCPFLALSPIKFNARQFSLLYGRLGMKVVQVAPTIIMLQTLDLPSAETIQGYIHFSTRN